MDRIPNNVGVAASSRPANNGVDTRVLRTMTLAVALAVIISAPFAPWRVTTGLLLGGLLSLLNHQWMRTSISATFAGALGAGTKPQFTSVKYILRYFVVAAAVLVAYKLGIVSVPATIAGLCSFVVALFVEAFREFYFAIIHREEIS
ncbi:MAG: ATP synthase subunit I [Pyrinomonadaceae bacterium]